ncbi:MAG TPA: tetratricopeptide repeat protein [Thermoanaerobaculia bacterium]|nr:tetratricopeptide repeat protein [Thermoanaerobaculia bacterium]
MIDGELQAALDLSMECEERTRANSSDSFAAQILKGAYLVSAQILTAQGKFDLARERLDKAKELPDSFLIDLDELMHTTEGYLLERSGQTTEVVKFYRKVATPYALAQLGKIYFDAGRREKALQVIKNSLKLNPSSPAAHAILGEILERSDKAAALREYKRALELASRGNPTIVAVIYIDVSRAKKGIQRLE